MDRQKMALLVLGVVVVLAVVVAVWSYRQTPGGKATPEAARKATALEHQVGAVQSNPNVPPQAKQWLEYNVRQQQAPAANYGR